MLSDPVCGSALAALNKPRILVVEDEESIADTIRYVLATDGLDPVWCATGTAALEVAAKDEIALAVLDVGLPISTASSCSAGCRRSVRRR